MKFNRSELAKITFNPKGNIAEQIKDNFGESIRTIGDYNSIYNEVYDNMTNKLYMDEVGQIWKPIAGELNDYQYIAKCRI